MRAATGHDARMLVDRRDAAADWPAVRAVYAEGIATGQATFEAAPPSWEDWDRDHLPECRLVARRDGARGRVGRARARFGAAGVPRRGGGEHVRGGRPSAAVGVGKDAGSRRWWRPSERAGIWTLEGWIFPENEASLALCESFGCRVVGVRERLGKMGDRWRDVLLVERRSRRSV